jgi:hypothetical protein
MARGGSCLLDGEVLRLLSGEIDDRKRESIEAHLERCEGCARLVGEAARETRSVDIFGPGSLRPPVLVPGTLVASRYHVLRLLGTGAMGEVHEVEDRLLDEVVALKTLNARLADDPSALPRLKSEAAASRRVTHPNVCRVFDLGVEWRHGDLGTLVFLTMERLQGKTLARILEERVRLPVGEALPLLEQIALALSAAHAVGIVHRDLKPANVMVVSAPDGQPRAIVTDFGLARSFVAGRATPADHALFAGTLAYAAPEQLAGGVATPASDVYSFGILASEVLTGQRSAAGSGDGSLYPVPGLPAGWQRALRRATQREPSRRFDGGASLVMALRDLEGAGQVAGPPRLVVPAARKALAALAALASLAGAIGYQSRQHSKAEAPMARAAVERLSPELAPAALDGPPSELACELGSAPSINQDHRGRQRSRSRGLPTTSVPEASERPAAGVQDQDLVREEELLRTVTFPQRETSAAPASDDPELVNPFGEHRRAVSNLR